MISHFTSMISSGSRPDLSQVLPAAAPRYAVTVWYFSEQELSEAARRKAADVGAEQAGGRLALHPVQPQSSVHSVVEDAAERMSAQRDSCCLL